MGSSERGNLVFRWIYFHVFHSDKRLSAFFAYVIDRANVWVVESGSGLSFALKASKRLSARAGTLEPQNDEGECPPPCKPPTSRPRRASRRCDSAGLFGHGSDGKLRVSESAVQYAERLLSVKSLPQGQTAATIAHRFVYGYKDHGFVIDRDEATEILSNHIVKSDSAEYRLANKIHEYLDTVSLAYGAFKNHFFKIIGDLSRGMIVRPKG